MLPLSDCSVNYYVWWAGFEALTAASMKVLAASTHRPDDGGYKYLWNVCELLPDYTAIQPKRQPSYCVWRSQLAGWPAAKLVFYVPLRSIILFSRYGVIPFSSNLILPDSCLELCALLCRPLLPVSRDFVGDVVCVAGLGPLSIGRWSPLSQDIASEFVIILCGAFGYDKFPLGFVCPVGQRARAGRLYFQDGIRYVLNSVDGFWFLCATRGVRAVIVAWTRPDAIVLQ
jgi:hypothetical protein